MLTEQDILACLSMVRFRARMFNYAMQDEFLKLPDHASEMALFDLEEAVTELREVYDQRANEIREARKPQRKNCPPRNR